MSDNTIPPEATEPVVFNGTELPLSVYWMELLVPILGDLSNEVEDFLLDLHYCGGVERRAASLMVSRHCQELSGRIRTGYAVILDELKDRMPFADAARTMHSWSEALSQMTLLATRSNECLWTRKGLVSSGDAEKMMKLLDQLGYQNEQSNQWPSDPQHQP